MESRRHRSRGHSLKRHNNHRDYRHQSPQDCDERAQHSSQRRRIIRARSPAQLLIADPVRRNAPQGASEEFIQSWLDDTRIHRPHFSEADLEHRTERVVLPARDTVDGHDRKKRARSSSRAPSTSRERGRLAENRFEKRARYKTREGKYDHGRDSGRKRVVVKERSDNCHRTKCARDEREEATGVFESLASKALKSRNAKHANLQAQKEQDEDRELKELSAFFRHKILDEKTPNEEHLLRARRDVLSSTSSGEDPAKDSLERRYHALPSLPPERRRRSSGTTEHRQLYQSSEPRSYASPHQRHPSNKSTSYFTWSTSRHGRAVDENFPSGAEPSCQSSSLSARKFHAQGTISEGFDRSTPHKHRVMEARRQQVYKDAESQTEPKINPPQEPCPQNKKPRYGDRGVMAGEACGAQLFRTLEGGGEQHIFVGGHDIGPYQHHEDLVRPGSAFIIRAQPQAHSGVPSERNSRIWLDTGPRDIAFLPPAMDGIRHSLLGTDPCIYRQVVDSGLRPPLERVAIAETATCDVYPPKVQQYGGLPAFAGGEGRLLSCEPRSRSPYIACLREDTSDSLQAGGRVVGDYDGYGRHGPAPTKRVRFSETMGDYIERIERETFQASNPNSNGVLADGHTAGSSAMSRHDLGGAPTGQDKDWYPLDLNPTYCAPVGLIPDFNYLENMNMYQDYIVE
ncbi:hypothetical protein B0T25DRAFT_525682 [Lasiosphaeria hispida]|uniref:Uncharacterized protein n=1 Tax=Lasiosphaeria hispida TaxID=260671 RepID=A0AAJ0HUJ6_9PEZI|nr:hypothetical protein B0T25DRAFT_525682 [Lasiosphaeria hispida]